MAQWVMKQKKKKRKKIKAVTIGWLGPPVLPVVTCVPEPLPALPGNRWHPGGREDYSHPLLGTGHRHLDWGGAGRGLVSRGGPSSDQCEECSSRLHHIPSPPKDRWTSEPSSPSPAASERDCLATGSLQR